MTALRVIHFGFHKTGTSTIEHMLLRNAKALAGHVEILGAPQLGPVVGLAKRYSGMPSALLLAQFQDAFAAALPPPDRPALISCVDLCGRIPGHPRVSDYSAASTLAGAMLEVCPAQLALGTRDAKDWLRSLWMQNLKVHRVTEDLDSFAARFEQLSDLDAQARRIEAVVNQPILRLPLEAGSAHPLGPAGPLLDLFDLPSDLRNVLEPQSPLKVGMSAEAAAVLLKINRAGLSDAELSRTKSDALSVLRTML